MTENQIIALVITVILSLNLIWIMAQCIIYFVSRRKEPTEYSVVTYSKSFLWLCVAIELIGNALIIWLLAAKNQDNAPAIGLMPFPFVGTLGMTVSLNWQITIEQDRFVVRNSFRAKSTYYFSEVSEILLAPRGVVFICLENKRIMLEFVLVGREKLMAKLNQTGVLIKKKEWGTP